MHTWGVPVPFGVTPFWLLVSGKPYLSHRLLAYQAPAVRATSPAAARAGKGRSYGEPVGPPATRWEHSVG